MPCCSQRASRSLSPLGTGTKEAQGSPRPAREIATAPPTQTPSGRDRIKGGTGGDEIRVRDGYRDVVNCQGGNDFVSNRDPIDVLRNC